MSETTEEVGEENITFESTAELSFTTEKSEGSDSKETSTTSKSTDRSELISTTMINFLTPKSNPNSEFTNEKPETSNPKKTDAVSTGTTDSEKNSIIRITKLLNSVTDLELLQPEQLKSSGNINSASTVIHPHKSDQSFGQISRYSSGSSYSEGMNLSQQGPGAVRRNHEFLSSNPSQSKISYKGSTKPSLQETFKLSPRYPRKGVNSNYVDVGTDNTVYSAESSLPELFSRTKYHLLTMADGSQSIIKLGKR